MSQASAEKIAVDQPLVGLTIVSQPLGRIMAMIRSIDLV